MAAYEYIAIDANGNKFSGVYDDVESISMLRKDLQRWGINCSRPNAKSPGLLNVQEILKMKL